MDELISMLEAVADQIGGKVHYEYSGRGMYGAQCVGIDTDDAIGCIEAAAAKGITGARQDQLGKGYIIYWPHISGGPVKG